MVYLIVAVDDQYGFASGGTIPWRFKSDLKYFADVTQDSCDSKLNAIIVGRTTWGTIPQKFRPLPNRVNIVVSTTMTPEDVNTLDNTYVVSSYPEAVKLCKNLEKVQVDKIFAIGGYRIYLEALEYGELDGVYMTWINANFNCNLHFPVRKMNGMYDMKETIVKELEEYDTRLKFLLYTPKYNYPKNVEEERYLKTASKLYNAKDRMTRNAITRSIFAPGPLEFDLRSGFPLLTTKKTFFKGIAQELIFFIRGETDALKLAEQGTKIWLGNTTREFLDNRKLNHYRVGDMGPMYGWNWRHFGAEYIDCDTNYTGKGFDQLKATFNSIKHDPGSRRHLITSLDPSKVEQAVLPPCHSLPIQFYVDDGYLDVQMYQRSADYFLGVPFNIASTSLFLSIMAKATGLTPRRMVIVFGDAHLYSEHLESIKKQLSRSPYPFPKLEINKNINSVEDMENLQYDDFKMVNYRSHSGIKAPLIA